MALGKAEMGERRDRLVVGTLGDEEIGAAVVNGGD